MIVAAFCGDLLYKYALDLYAIRRGTSFALKSHIMTMLMLFGHTSVFFGGGIIY